MESLNIRFGELPFQAEFSWNGQKYTKIVESKHRQFIHNLPKGVNCYLIGEREYDPETYRVCPDDQMVQVNASNGIRIKSLNEIMAQPAPPPDLKLRKELEELRKTLED